MRDATILENTWEYIQALDIKWNVREGEGKVVYNILTELFKQFTFLPAANKNSVKFQLHQKLSFKH